MDISFSVLCVSFPLFLLEIPEQESKDKCMNMYDTSVISSLIRSLL